MHIIKLTVVCSTNSLQQIEAMGIQWPCFCVVFSAVRPVVMNGRQLQNAERPVNVNFVYMYTDWNQLLMMGGK